MLPLAIKNSMKLVAFSFLRIGSDGKIDKEQGVVTFGYKEAEQVDVALQWM